MEESKNPNKEPKGLRYNGDKPKWSLVDFKSLEPMVRVLEYGAAKYTVKDESGKVIATGRDNWKNGMIPSEVTESLLRHVFALLRGEMNDPESGLPHTGHIMCNAMFLEYNLQNFPELNDLKK